MSGTVPAAFAWATFGSPRLTMDRHNQAAWNACWDFTQRFPQGKGLLLTGPTGTGKTVLAACVANALGPARVYWANFPTWLDALRPGSASLRERAQACYAGPGNYGNCGAIRYGMHSPVCDLCPARSHASPLERACTSPLLILDDLGAGKLTEWGQEQLYRVLNDRLENSRPVLGTTNLTLEELAEYLGHPRLASRLYALCRVYRLTGPDRRLQVVQLSLERKIERKAVQAK